MKINATTIRLERLEGSDDEAVLSGGDDQRIGTEAQRAAIEAWKWRSVVSYVTAYGFSSKASSGGDGGTLEAAVAAGWRDFACARREGRTDVRFEVQAYCGACDGGSCPVCKGGPADGARPW